MAEIGKIIPYFIAMVLLGLMTYYAFHYVSAQVGYIGFAITALTVFQTIKVAKDELIGD